MVKEQIKNKRRIQKREKKRTQKQSHQSSAQKVRAFSFPTFSCITAGVASLSCQMTELCLLISASALEKENGWFRVIGRLSPWQ